MGLDLSKPHSMVIGLGGIQSYTQDGIVYGANKKPLPPKPDTGNPASVATEPSEPVAVVETAAPAAVEVAASTPSLTDLQNAHWSHLKKMVEDRGGVWIDKHAAIEFLTKG